MYYESVGRQNEPGNALWEVQLGIIGLWLIHKSALAMWTYEHGAISYDISQYLRVANAERGREVLPGDSEACHFPLETNIEALPPRRPVPLLWRTLTREGSLATIK